MPYQTPGSSLFTTGQSLSTIRESRHKIMDHATQENRPFDIAMPRFFETHLFLRKRLNKFILRLCEIQRLFMSIGNQSLIILYIKITPTIPSKQIRICRKYSIVSNFPPTETTPINGGGSYISTVFKKRQKYTFCHTENINAPPSLTPARPPLRHSGRKPGGVFDSDGHSPDTDFFLPRQHIQQECTKIVLSEHTTNTESKIIQKPTRDRREGERIGDQSVQREAAEMFTRCDMTTEPG